MKKTKNKENSTNIFINVHINFMLKYELLCIKKKLVYIHTYYGHYYQHTLLQAVSKQWSASSETKN